MTRPDNTTPHKASDYDQNVRQSIPFYEMLHGEVLDLVKTVKPDAASWLDTGCGTGYLVEQALPLFPKTQFTMADPSEAMLQQARSRLEAAGGVGRVRFLSPAGSEALPSQLDENPFQVITAVQCHHYLQPEARKQAIKACFELLEEGGLLVTTENISMFTRQGVKIGLERWGQWQRRAGRSPLAVAEHLKRFDSEYFPISVEKHLRLLAGTGFRTYEIFWLSQMQAGFYAIK